MQTSQWLDNVGIAQVHVADGKHDGYVDVHVGVSFNQKGVTALGRHCTSKVKGLDSVAADSKSKIIKFVAKPKPEGGTLNAGELRKLANGAIRSMIAWTATLDELDVMMYTNDLSLAEIVAVMAGHSETRHHLASDT